MRVYDVVSRLTGYGVLLGIVLASSVAARAGEIQFPTASTGTLAVRVTSVRERRFANVVQQHQDFTCGAASIATILRYAFDEDIDEATVIAGMLAVSDPAIVRERGFSVLDMKNYINARHGLNSNGFQLSLEALRKVVVPTIVLLNIEGYEHFVVVRHAYGRQVLVADPARGNRTMPIDEFAKSWNGVVFAIAGNAYRRSNPLSDAVPLPDAARMLAGIGGLPDPLTEATLTTIGVPPMQRL